MPESKKRFDPALTEIMSRKFTSITDQMTVKLRRASRSVYVKEGGDFGVALIDREGHTFAWPDMTSVNAIEHFCMPAIKAVGKLVPGDVIITNDPYSSQGLATHVPDLQLIMPYFHGDQIVAYGWCFIHFIDMGGRVPSSISPSSTEIFQEGILVPPLKLMKAGVPNDDLFAMIATNTRLPDQNVADLKAMVGTLTVGEQHVADLIKEVGLEVFLSAQTDVQEYSAARSRDALRLLPDGVYEAWDYLDDDVVTRIPIRIHIKLTIEDGMVELDLSGTDPQVAAAYNVPTMGRLHSWLTVALTRFIVSNAPGVPLNYGMYRHMSAINPKGTILNAEFPDPVGIRQAVGARVNDAIQAALMKARPDLCSTPSGGVVVPVVLAEADSVGGNRNLTVVEPFIGGTGAYNGDDGVDSRDASMANLNNHPIEVIENDIGLIVREYDVRPDSGGPGKWRGGTGQTLSFEVLKDGGVVMSRGMERTVFTAWGFDGGMPARAFRVIVNRGRPDERELRKIDQLPVNKGDVVTFLSPGGGGYGDPFERDPAAVTRDVQLGFVSSEGARDDYGVAIMADGSVDEAATRKLRDGRSAAGKNDLFRHSRDREAWEQVFDDATMRKLNQHLYAQPKPVRQKLRRAFFEAVVPQLNHESRPPIGDLLADAGQARERLKKALAALPQ
ncbi:MAG: hydantoinase B/oxoprolinase family protein [Rhizobiaceae bacterium]